MIGDAAYKSTWYDLKPSDSKLIFFIILRSQRRLTITAGKIMDLSLEGFTSVRFLHCVFTPNFPLIKSYSPLLNNTDLFLMTLFWIIDLLYRVIFRKISLLMRVIEKIFILKIFNWLLFGWLFKLFYLYIGILFYFVLFILLLFNMIFIDPKGICFVCVSIACDVLKMFEDKSSCLIAIKSIGIFLSILVCWYRFDIYDVNRWWL